MEEPLIRVLGLIAGELEPAARSRFLQSVPPALRPAVERLGSQEAGQLELTPAEAELLAPLELSTPDEEAGSPLAGDEENPAHTDEAVRTADDIQTDEPRTGPGTGEVVDAEMRAEAEQDPLAGQVLGPDSAWPPETGEPALPVLLALLASAAPTERAASLLQHLPLDLQASVVRRLAVPAGPAPERGLSGEAATWAADLTAALGTLPEPSPGLACRVLRTLSSSRGLRDLLNALDALDHETLLHLQLHLFVFADLALLPDREVQVLLGRVDNQTLARALQLCPEALQRRLLANVSDRRRLLLAEEEEQEAYAPPDGVEAAHLRMMAIAQDLYEQGRISTYLGSIGPGEPAPSRPAEGIEEADASGPSAHPAPRRRRGPIIAGGLVLACSVVLFWIVGQVGRPMPGRSGSGEPGSGADGELRLTVLRDGTVAGAKELLDSSGTWATPAGVQAVLELPEYAKFVMEEETRVERPAENDTAGSGGIYLRVGAARTTVLERPFEIRTPTVKVIGQPGAVFTTRVVLDATTVVEVAAGVVEVVSLVRPPDHWSLEAGAEGRFGPRGGGAIRR